MTYINVDSNNSPASSKMGKTTPSISVIDLIVQFVRRLVDRVVGKSNRLNQAVAANPKYEEKPQVSPIKDKVWKIITAPHQTQKPWRPECQKRVNAALNLIKKSTGNRPELQNAVWFLEDYLKPLPDLYSSYDEFMQNIKPSLTQYETKRI